MAGVRLALFVLTHLAVVALIVSTALALGLPWIRRLSMTTGERAGVAAALGLAAMGHVALLLGLAGRLEPAATLAVVLIAHVIAWRDVRDLLSRAWGAWRPWERRARWLGAALGALALSPIVLCALYPPTAFDETLYHLPYAREFARTHGLPFLPDLRFPIFPQLVEAILAAVLPLAGDVATHGVSLTATLVTALLVFVWAGRTAGTGATAGWLAAAFWLGQPLGVYLSGTAYVEPALALFTAGAVHGVERWRGGGERRWLVLAGVFAGTAASTKYLGLIVVAGAFIHVAVVAARRSGVRDVLAYGAAVVATAAVSYGRLLHHTGNPVFPFAPSVFGSTPWDGTAFVRKLGVQDGAGLLSLVSGLVFDRAGVGGLPPLSPLLPLGLPLILAVALRNHHLVPERNHHLVPERNHRLVPERNHHLVPERNHRLVPERNHHVRIWMSWVVGFALLAPVAAHYFWTIVPLVALAFGVSCAWALARLRGARWAAGAVLAVSRPWVCAMLCVLPGWLYGVYQLSRLGPMPADGPGRAAFLTARLPLYPAVSFVNDRCGARCALYAVHAEHMAYHASGRFLGDWNGPASFARTLADGDAAAFSARLSKLGADYLLVPIAARRWTGLSGADAPGFRHVYGDAAADVYEVSPPGAAPSRPSSR